MPKKADPRFTRKNAKRRKNPKRVSQKEKEISELLIKQQELEKQHSAHNEPRINSDASEGSNGESMPVAPHDVSEANVEPSTPHPVEPEPPETSDTPAAAVQKREPFGDKKITEADRLVAAQRRIIHFLTGKRNPNHNERRTIQNILTRSERYLRTVDRGLL